jgi:hypothetical protein
VLAEEVDGDGDGPSETERTRADVKKRRIEKEEEKAENNDSGAGAGASRPCPCCPWPWLPASASVAAGRGGRGRGVRRDRVRVLDDVIRVPVPRLPETRRTFAHIRLGGVGADAGKESASGAQSRRSHGFHLHLHATDPTTTTRIPWHGVCRR